MSIETEHFPEIHKTENSSIWIGRVKRLFLYGTTAKILPKLRIHEENVMEGLTLYIRDWRHIRDTQNGEQQSLAGKVKKLELSRYAVAILPKLRIHGKMRWMELELNADRAGHITEILEMENKNIWIGKVKKLGFTGRICKRDRGQA
ncbi:MAG: uncharacterized protein A8A55_0275 [Amphiamblys sp. WSBS2006]|nr:MAG: uncharacterized protein A8A55_0275 [Amphiamblys sp. WSBS2006]